MSFCSTRDYAIVDENIPYDLICKQGAYKLGRKTRDVAENHGTTYYKQQEKKHENYWTQLETFLMASGLICH